MRYEKKKYLIIFLGILSLFLTEKCIKEIYLLGIIQFIVLIGILSGILFNYKVKEKISIIVVSAYFLLVLLTSIEVFLYRNQAQYQLCWCKLDGLILPFQDIYFSLMHHFQRILPESENVIINNIIPSAVSLIIIGFPFFYLLSKWIEGLWIIVNMKIKVRNAADLDSQLYTYLIRSVKDLWIIFTLCFLMFFYFLVGYSQWDKINYQRTLYLASYMAKKDFRDGKIRYFKLGGEGKKAYFTGKKINGVEIWTQPFSHFWLPYYVDRKRFVENYNLRMSQLLRKNEIKRK